MQPHLYDLHLLHPPHHTNLVYLLGQCLTKHGLEADSAVDVVVKVDAPVAVAVALDQGIERGVTHTEPYNTSNTNQALNLGILN